MINMVELIISVFENIMTIIGVVSALWIYWSWRKDYKAKKNHEYSIELLKKLGKFPLFTENDVAKIINKGRDYVKTSIYRLHKKGLITRIEKGKYSLYDDPLIFSSYITTPSYFSLWTALRYYNLTQQQPLDLFVISPISRKPIKLKNEKIFFSKTKHMYGYKKLRYEDLVMLTCS